MATNYPAALDDSTVFPTRSAGTATALNHAADHNNLKDAVVAIETELGTAPSDAYATVKARLEGMSRVDTLSNIGSAASYPGGRFFATDILAEYLSDGSQWIRTSSPAGETVIFDGLTLPVNLVRKDGSLVSRTGIYAELFAAQTKLFSGATGNSGQAVLTISGSTEGLGVGQKVEGTGVPAGATIASLVANTSITLSGNLTTSGARDIRIFPNGNGNGSTTWNLPDWKGRTAVGRDNMGGTAANRLTVDSTRVPSTTVIGSTGGEQKHTLQTAELAQHSHTVNSHDHGGATGGARSSWINHLPTQGAGSHGHSGSAQYNGDHAHNVDPTFGSSAVAGSAASSTWGGTRLQSDAAGGRWIYDTDMISTTNGGHTHTLTVDAVGDHTHITHIDYLNSATYQSTHAHSITAQSPGTTDAGSSTAHSSMQPYVLCDICLRL